MLKFRRNKDLAADFNRSISPVLDPIEPLDDPEVDYFEIPQEHLDIRPLAHKKGQIAKAASTRPKRLTVGMQIAVLGPEKEIPYWILKITKLRKMTFDFQWYNRDAKGRYSLCPETNTEPHLFATYLHWGSDLFKLDSKLRKSTLTAMSSHRYKEGEKKQRN